MPSLSAIWPAIERTAKACGALHAGASTLDDAHEERFPEWIARGHHATMRYLEKNVAIRSDPHARYPWARSAIAIVVPYCGERPPAPAGAISHHIARYALGDDYHEILDGILREIETVIAREAPGSKTWRHVDTGPLSDRSLAAQAGLGWIGKNGMLIHERDGSWLFIGTLITSLDLDMTFAEVADRCGACTRCVDACPTEAILPGRIVDSARCISYATIEHRGPLDEPVANLLHGNAFGCDICNEVCPWNEHPPAPHPAFEPRDGYRNTPVTDLLRITQSGFSELFRRSPIKRAKREGMKRNVEAMTGSAEDQCEY